jgi:hypothetical protein
MNKTNLTIATKDGVSKLTKPKFGPGMLLRAEDLDLLKDYTTELSRLMFRSLFGCGVVCGLVVKVYEDCGMVIVEVGSGLAIACSGYPIYVPKDVTFPLHDDCDDVTVDEEVWVMLCSKEKCCGPRTSMCASDEDDSPTECTREKDWWEIKVVSGPPDCVCSCIEPEVKDQPNPQQTGQTLIVRQTSSLSTTGNEIDCWCADPTSDCYKDHYNGVCGCHCGDCSDCECKCVLLAYAQRQGDTDTWKVEHKVRRFVRPVLMRDPQAWKEAHPQSATASSMSMQDFPKSVQQGAIVAAGEEAIKETEIAAQEAIRKTFKSVATEIGQSAAALVMKQVVDDVTRQAEIDKIVESTSTSTTEVPRPNIITAPRPTTTTTPVPAPTPAPPPAPAPAPVPAVPAVPPEKTPTETEGTYESGASKAKKKPTKTSAKKPG